jgi:hypothetical protein
LKAAAEKAVPAHLRLHPLSNNHGANLTEEFLDAAAPKLLRK